MKKTIRKNSIPLPAFECGQVWQMLDSSLRIGLVGKRLVHYQHFNALIKRPNVHLSNKGDLEKFLQKHRAILLPDAPPLSSGAGGRSPSRRKPGRESEAKAS